MHCLGLSSVFPVSFPSFTTCSKCGIRTWKECENRCFVDVRILKAKNNMCDFNDVIIKGIMGESCINMCS